LFSEIDTDCDGTLDISLLASGHYFFCTLDSSRFVNCMNTISNAESLSITPIQQIFDLGETLCTEYIDERVSCTTVSPEYSENEYTSIFDIDQEEFQYCSIDNLGFISCVEEEHHTPPEDISVVAIGSSFFQGCAIDGVGSIHCWGEHAETLNDIPLGNFSQIVVGDFHACALNIAGQIHCWGPNNFDGEYPTEGRFLQISGGTNHSCALEDTGKVSCWGFVGDEDSTEIDIPEDFVSFPWGG
jgi:hypothetical protein